MKLERFCYSEVGTFGKLTVGGKVFYTVEPPWDDNKPFVSCIPEGNYAVSHDMTGEFRGFALADVKGRSDIEMHVGNTKKHTEGCILPGLGLGFVAGLWAVTNSKAAMRELKRLIPKDEAKIEITSVFASKPASKKKAAARSE